MCTDVFRCSVDVDCWPHWVCLHWWLVVSVGEQESTMPEGRQHDEGPLRPRSVVSVYKLDNVFRHTWYCAKLTSGNNLESVQYFCAPINTIPGLWILLREDDHGAGEMERDLPAVLHLHEDPAEPEGRQVMPASDWSILVILASHWPGPPPP